MQPVRQARVLGVRVDCVDMDGALTRIESFVDAGGRHQVATVNPEFVMRAGEDTEVHHVQQCHGARVESLESRFALPEKPRVR